MKKLSRRLFMQKSAVVAGAVAAHDLASLLMTDQAAASSAYTSESIGQERRAHVMVQLFPGRQEQTKLDLARAIADDVVNIIGCNRDSVSVSVEDVPSSAWKEKVYDPGIIENSDKIYKKPGYSM